MFKTTKRILATAVVVVTAAAPSIAVADTPTSGSAPTVSEIVVTKAVDSPTPKVHASKLSPPVIHESFSVLPCAGAPGHRSTLDEEGCAEHQILRSDDTIDALNESIFAKLGGDPARRRFIAGHKAWIAYRHAYCLSLSDVFEGGTEAGVIDADCVASVSNRHVKDLRGFLGDLGSN